MEGSATKKIVLLGKTGSGKSSLAKTIFGEELFPVNDGFNSGTKTCETKTKRVDGYDISLIDTPGFFDTDRPEDELKSEILKCIIECSSGVHAFLIVLKWERFTEQEQAVLDKICSYFSDEVLKYAVVVFTHGDQLPEGKKIEEFISQNERISNLVEKCGGRCHIIDNKHWNKDSGDEYRTNQFQVKELLNTINKMVIKNGGRVYTNEMLEEVQRRIIEETEVIRKSSGSWSWREIINKAKEKVFNILKMSAGVTTGMLLGAFLGVAAMTVIVVSLLGTSSVKVLGYAATATGCSAASLGVGIAAVAAAGGAAVGGYCGYEEAQEADSVGEAVMNTAAAVAEPCMKMVKKFCKTERGKREDGMCQKIKFD